MVILADLLAVLHMLAIITLLISPVMFVISRRRIRWLEKLFLVVSAVTVLSYLITWECFLTTWEQSIRVRFAPATAYSEGFVRHYLGHLGVNWSDAATLPLAIFVMGFGVCAALLRRQRSLARHRG